MSVNEVNLELVSAFVSQMMYVLIFELRLQDIMSPTGQCTEVVGSHPGANPTIVSYKASAVYTYNTSK
jgi:hypothetical protein